MNLETDKSTGVVRPLAWRIAGILSLAVGVVGIVLPLVPTTPMLILSAYCFARGSERLHRWLVDHPRFGPPIRDWEEHRAISRKGKIMSALAMIAVVITSIVLEAPRTIVAAQVVVLSLSGTFIFTRPTRG